jgi:CheY-like chemotaxis protein
MTTKHRYFSVPTGLDVVKDRPERARTTEERGRDSASQIHLRHIVPAEIAMQDTRDGAPSGSEAAHESMAPSHLYSVVPVEILLVEDSPGDIRLTQEALRAAKVKNNLHVVVDGMEATSFLRREGRHAGAPRPDLILLDLNLPKKNGQEVLADIKLDPQLRTIPVVILTTSVDEEDILRSYQLHANCYITKPVDLDQFLRVIKAIDNFWLTIVKLPRDATS